jgi:hypothetical protein
MCIRTPRLDTCKFERRTSPHFVRVRDLKSCVCQRNAPHLRGVFRDAVRESAVDEARRCSVFGRHNLKLCV